MDKEIYKSTKLLSFLTALCLFFSAIEYAIPKPFPFFRLGLANLPIILSFYILRPRDSIILIMLKIFVQNLISGTLFSYTILFSICGSISSGVIMLLLFRLNLYKDEKLFSLKGISLAGSFFNCISQLTVSYFFIFGQNTKYIAPLFLVLSFVTGLMLGLICEFFVKNSKWFHLVRSDGTR